MKRPFQDSLTVLKATRNWEEKVIMLVVSALGCGYGDYTHAVPNTPSLRERAEAANKGQLQRAIRLRASGSRPFENGNRMLYFVLNSLARACLQSREGWATIAQGSDRRNGVRSGGDRPWLCGLSHQHSIVKQPAV